MKRVLLLALTVIMVVNLSGCALVALFESKEEIKSRKEALSNKIDDTIDLLENEDESIECPNFVGMTIEQAEKNEYFKSLDVEWAYVQNNEYSVGVICDQSIPRNKTIKKGAKIVLYISKGAQNIKVPDLYGQSETYAVSNLKALGLVATIRYVPSDEVEDGYVIKTTPARTTVVAEGAEITIYVSSGKRVVMVDVPHVVGLKKEKAAELIEKAGLIPEFEERDLVAAEKDFKKGYVVAQEPVADSYESVKEGSTIKVYVSTGVVRYTYSPVAPIREDFVNYKDTGYVSIWDEDGNIIAESTEIIFSGNEDIYYFNEFTTNNLEVRYIARVRFGTDSTWYDYASITFDAERNHIYSGTLIDDYQDYNQ